MLRRLFFIIILLGISILRGSLPVAAEDLPNCRNLALNTNRTITPPDADVPEYVGAYSGAWEGKWNKAKDSGIVFNKVTQTTVSASFVVNGVQQGSSATFQVAEDGTLTADSPLQAGLSLTMTWRLSDDRATLRGTSGLSNYPPSERAEFYRCAP
jgi:hypothetical protein